MGSTRPRLQDSINPQRWRPVASLGAAGFAACLAFVCLTRVVGAQETDQRPQIPNRNEMDDTTVIKFKSTADSVAWERSRRAALKAPGLRVVVSLREREVWVMRGADTLRSAKAAVASGLTVEMAGRSWTFRTPRGRHTVLRKVENPVWRPPDWLYAEAAVFHNLELARLRPDHPVRVSDDELLVLRNGHAGLLDTKTKEFSPLPTDEHIVFNDTLYIPPLPTANRRVEGELGRYALDLGDGYMIHGTADPKSIGRAVTHGCIRLADDDIDWLYRNVPVGTVVLIY